MMAPSKIGFLPFYQFYCLETCSTFMQFRGNRFLASPRRRSLAFWSACPPRASVGVASCCCHMSTCLPPSPNRLMGTFQRHVAEWLITCLGRQQHTLRRENSPDMNDLSCPGKTALEGPSLQSQATVPEAPWTASSACPQVSDRHCGPSARGVSAPPARAASGAHAARSTPCSAP